MIDKIKRVLYNTLKGGDMDSTVSAKKGWEGFELKYTGQDPRVHKVGVIASSRDGVPETFYEQARKFGELLGAQKRSFVYRGKVDGPLNEARRVWEGIAGFCWWNQWKDIKSDLDEILRRKIVLTEKSDGFIALPCDLVGLDDLTDIMIYMYMQSYKPKDQQRRKPIILINSNGFFDLVDELFDSMIREGFLKPGAKDIYIKVRTPEEAIAAIEEWERNSDKVKPLSPMANVGGSDEELQNIKADEQFGALGEKKKAFLQEESMRRPHAIKRITVFSGSSAGTDPKYMEDAAFIGEYIRKSGRELLNGGGTRGCMGATMHAFIDGMTEQEIHDRMHSISLRAFEQKEEYPTRKFEVLHDNVYDRKRMMIESSQALIALPGGLGTLDEILDAMRYNQACYLNGKIDQTMPIILVNTNGIYDAFIKMIDRTIEMGIETPDIRKTFVVAKDINHAVTLLESFDAILQAQAGKAREVITPTVS